MVAEMKEQETKTNLGIVIRKLREVMDFYEIKSQTELANLSGISSAAVSMWFSGATPRITHILSLCQKKQINPLFFLLDDMKVEDSPLNKNQICKSEQSDNEYLNRILSTITSIDPQNTRLLSTIADILDVLAAKEK
jgi:transcriptional regulator with XRE-family HTH domain